MQTLDWPAFASLLSKYTSAPEIADDALLFGGGLDLSSIGFTEFIMELEEDLGRDIDIEDLDASVRTAGQLFARLSAKL